MDYDRTSSNPIYDGAKHYSRDAEGVPCRCGGYMDSVEPTAEEELAFGCGRRGCCSRAFVCRTCHERVGGWAEAPEME